MKTSAYCLSLFGLLAFAASLWAGPIDSPSVPALVNYQGYVTDDVDTPLGDLEPTNYDVQFRLYDQKTDGNLLWGEAQTVTISSGHFSVLLGNGSAIDGTTPHDTLEVLFAPGGTVFDVGAVFLGLTVNEVGATDAGEFNHRQQIVANPFALRAKQADLAQSALTVAEGSINATSYAAGSITGGDTGAIAAETISTVNLVNGAVDASKIAADAVGSDEIGTDAVGGDEIGTDAVGSDEIGTDAVGSDEIADDAVGSDEIAENSVTALHTDFASIPNGDDHQLSLFPRANPNTSLRIFDGGRFFFEDNDRGLQGMLTYDANKLGMSAGSLEVADDSYDDSDARSPVKSRYMLVFNEEGELDGGVEGQSPRLLAFKDDRRSH